ncbi:MAG TPA: TolC family protein [Gemmatimonadales bacterium]|nr:TolC family protein [Gemmatimonadales bacterium]
MTRLLRAVLESGFVAAALMTTVSVVAAQLPIVTLPEARKMAQAVQPTVVGALGAVHNADAQVRSAKGAWLPSLSASSFGGTTYQEGPPRVNSSTGELVGGNTSSQNLNFGLNASWDLFTGFRRGADSRAAHAARDAAEAGLIDANYQASLAATQQFFTALAAQQLVRVREASVLRAEEQLKLAIAKLHAGSATRSDSLRSVVTLGSTQLALVSALADVAAAQAELARLIGAEGRVMAADDSAFYQVESQLDTLALLKEALAESPRVQAAEASARAADANLASTKSTYWPTLTLGASTGWSGTENRNWQLFNQRQLGVGLNWNLFNGFNREESITIRSSTLDQAEATASDTRRQVSSVLTAQFALLDAARLKIDIAQTSVAAAQEDLRVVEQRYRVGAATILDLLNSQEALTQAEVDAVAARFDYLRAKAQIEALIGRDL